MKNKIKWAVRRHPILYYIRFALICKNIPADLDDENCFNSLNSKNSNISETISTSIQTDFIYDTKFFTQELENFTALGFLSDGSKIIPPQKLKLIPYFLYKEDFHEKFY